MVAVDPTTGLSYEAVVNLGLNMLELWEQLPSGIDTSFASDELNAIHDMVLDDPIILERLSIYGEFYGNKSNVVTDVW